MKKENLFYVLILLTIILTRISIFLVPEVDIRLFGFSIHHFLFGIPLIILGKIFHKQKYLKIFLVGIGFGLMLDEFTFIILGAGMDRQYWDVFSVIGTILFTGIFYFVRKKVLALFN